MPPLMLHHSQGKFLNFRFHTHRPLGHALEIKLIHAFIHIQNIHIYVQNKNARNSNIHVIPNRVQNNPEHCSYRCYNLPF